MASEPVEIADVVRRYIAVLERNGVPIKEAFLFGSFAKGTAGPFSDIDVAIVSDHFSGDRFEDRRRIVPLRRAVDDRLEPMPFRPEDFENGGIFAEEIKNTGLPILKH
jgi:predicted nucleotidyltransferase